MVDQTTEKQHAAYERIHSEAEFSDLRRRHRSFIIPFTITFLLWYILYVVCANWAGGFMNIKVLGNINVAIIFGLLQFVSTFVIMWLYSRHSNRKLDPMASSLEADYRREVEQ